MNKELNKKLAEWRWPEYVSIEFAKDNSISGKTKEGQCHWLTVSLTESLDACFKYLVPKLYEDMIYGKINQGDFDESDYIGLLVDWAESTAKDKKEPALALCLAIEKMVENEG